MVYVLLFVSSTHIPKTFLYCNRTWNVPDSDEVATPSKVMFAFAFAWVDSTVAVGLVPCTHAMAVGPTADAVMTVVRQNATQAAMNIANKCFFFKTNHLLLKNSLEKISKIVHKLDENKKHFCLLMLK